MHLIARGVVIMQQGEVPRHLRNRP
jgi:hypothetical protein